MKRQTRSVIFNILFLLICAAIAFGVSKYIFTTIPVDGISMEQTLHNGDKILLYKVGNYRFGDVVVFDSHQRDSNGNEKYLVKRIIGLPGDYVEILLDEEDGNYYVWRNGEKLQEEYTNPEQPMHREMARVTVPDGKFFYMGDNRGPSADSREGPLGDLDSILGRVLLRYQTIDGDFDISVINRV